MLPRERIQKTLNHIEPDRIPLDFGASPVSGIHVQMVYRLRQALGLDAPGTPVKIIEPYQNLGEIKPDLMDAIGIDVVNLRPRKSLFGFEFEGWKDWISFDGTPVLVPAGYNIEPASDGNIYMYPEGDQSVGPSAVLLKGGWHFEATNRQLPIPADDQEIIEGNLEEFGIISDEDLEYYKIESERLYCETDKAILANFGGTSFGNVGLLPGIQLREAKGIRDVEEWYISLISRPDVIYQIFEKQCELGLENFKRVYGAVGDRISIVQITGTDFGAQNGLLVSPRTYRNLFKPFHKILCDWIHENTSWKIFIHTDGDVMALIPDFIEAGFDILNPVQTNIPNMNPIQLKQKFGELITFWGAGIDTQYTLPFGSQEECRQEVINKVRTLGPGGGFVFGAVHNVQPLVPVENLLTVIQTLRELGSYPIK